ncbi:MAG TPA: hypothetical protein VLI46_14365 [Ramlibacter sp.]|nr:hypothetical protein [Ramlibacter sp.]
MPVKSYVLILAALAGAGAASPAAAQAVYKCWSRSSVTYSQQPCSRRTVDTADALVPVETNPRQVDLRRMEQNRVLARSLRQRPGESAAQFEVRSRRARLMPEDRDECARLDTRMPVEAASLTNPDKEEVLKAETALAKSRKRFRQLRC